jgi:acyl-CoA thioesterase-1
MRSILLSLFVTVFAVTALGAADVYVPEAGSAELKKKKKRKVVVKHDPSLPNVLVIGDSISIGYTPHLQQELKGVCNIIRPKGNHQGTTFGLTIVEQLLASQKNWDVVHFNWGLHDLKHVKTAGTSQTSNSPTDPQQADPTAYRANLTELVEKLKAGTDAKLIFATTTPYPDVSGPLRKASYAVAYNKIAKEIMATNDVAINDLHAFMLPQLEKLQRRKNVHFTPAGSAALAGEAAKAIRKHLQKK